jgi:integrase
MDLNAGEIRVRKQLSRTGERVEPKTEQAIREVVLMPALAKLLREHKLRSRYSRDADFVLASERGTPLHYRNIVRRGLEPALAKAGLVHLRWHDLRHGFASMLIAQGESVVWISRQLGHSSPSVTLNVYAHLFAGHEHAERMRSRMEKSFGDLLGEHVGEHTDPSPAVPAPPAPVAELAQLRGIGTDG